MRKIRLQKSGRDRLVERFEKELNESQREAATAPDGFNLILAGPGSGKTRVITYRVAYLIARGVPAESILLVTFTRRAAREMLGRLESLIGAPAARVWAGTFHHIGNRILRRYAEPLGYGPNFTILDGEDQRDMIKSAMDSAGLVGTGKLAPNAALVQHLISFSFNVGRSLAELVAERHPRYIEWLPQLNVAAKLYADRKKAANSLDYDDLLGQWSRSLSEYPELRAAQAKMFQQILIDEMQDTNSVQAAVVETLALEGHGNLTAVGDDAQSIYGFRGANYDNILKFPERHPGTRVIRLDVNYRSTPEIVAFTNASISHNTIGFPKDLVSARSAGALPMVVPASDSTEEAEFICQQILDWREQGVALGRMAVLYRNHHDSVMLQAELVSRGIPYAVRSGMRFFEQAHIKDVLSYLRVLVNGQDESAWKRLLLLLPGIGPVKAGAVVERISAAPDPLAAIATKETMDLIPSKSKGQFAAFIADLRSIQAVDPESNPAAAVNAILKGGYPELAKARYERADNRIADVEQLSILAARYDSLEKLIADLLLAGDVYGVDSMGSEETTDQLVLTSIHQAKGLEWSRVIVIGLVDEGFPNLRALDEPGGEEEERRIFYVAATRAMDELYFTYPLLIQRGGRGPTLIAKPSRFLTEVPQELVEQAVLETEIDLAWSIRPKYESAGEPKS